jgi:hypothetical protein
MTVCYCDSLLCAVIGSKVLNDRHSSKATAVRHIAVSQL